MDRKLRLVTAKIRVTVKSNFVGSAFEKRNWRHTFRDAKTKISRGTGGSECFHSAARIDGSM